MPKQQTVVTNNTDLLQKFKSLRRWWKMGQEGMLFLSSTGQGSFFLPVQQIASLQKGGRTVLVYSPNIKGCLQNLHTTIKDTIIFPFTKELQKKLCFTWKYNNSTRVSEIWLLLCLLTDCVSSSQYCFRCSKRWKATTLS